MTTALQLAWTILFARLLGTSLQMSGHMGSASFTGLSGADAFLIPFELVLMTLGLLAGLIGRLRSFAALASLAALVEVFRMTSIAPDMVMWAQAASPCNGFGAIVMWNLFVGALNVAVVGLCVPTLLERGRRA